MFRKRIFFDNYPHFGFSFWTEYQKLLKESWFSDQTSHIVGSIARISETSIEICAFSIIYLFRLITSQAQPYLQRGVSSARAQGTDGHQWVSITLCALCISSCSSLQNRDRRPAQQMETCQFYFSKLLSCVRSFKAFLFNKYPPSSAHRVSQKGNKVFVDSCSKCQLFLRGWLPGQEPSIS